MGYMPSYEDLWGLSLCFCRGQNVLFKPLELETIFGIARSKNNSGGDVF